MAPRRYGLRIKFIATMVFSVAACLLATGAILIHYAHEEIERDERVDLTTIARNVSAQVAETLGGVHYEMDFLSRDPDVMSLDPARARRAVTLVTETTQLIDTIFFVDPAGRLIARADDPMSLRLEPSSYSMFVDALKASPSARFSSLYVTKTGELAIAALAPVIRGGKVVAVLAGATILRLHSIGGIEGITVGRSGYSYIVGPEGRAIVYPKGRYIDRSFSRLPELSALIKNRQGVAEYVDEQGERMLAAYAAVPRVGWGAVVCQPVAESYKFADKLRVVMSLILLAGLTIAAGIGALVADRLAEPITALAGGVRSVAAGDLTVNIPVARRDEIGDLSEDFNEMTRRLDLQRSRIERAHAEMLQAEKSLARSEKMVAIGSLAAGLAHEIHNPLTVISGFGEFLLKKTSASDPQRGPLEDILRETSRCRRLVSQLLDFAKPKEAERTPTDFNGLIRETLGLVRSQIKAQGIALEERLAPELPAVELDRDEIKQVFLNLFLNACQAMPAGGILSVSTRATDAGVEAVVEDDGVGIPEQQAPKIFDAFFTTKPGGTGLGLALSYAMLERHGGRIEVTSRPGAGARFTISLPLRRRTGASDEKTS